MGTVTIGINYRSDISAIAGVLELVYELRYDLSKIIELVPDLHKDIS
jgi:hypothetical protein